MFIVKKKKKKKRNCTKYTWEVQVLFMPNEPLFLAPFVGWLVGFCYL